LSGRIYKRGRTYWVAFYHEGKEYRKSALTERKREAEKVLQHYLHQVATGTFRGFTQEKTLTVGEMLDDLVSYAERNHLRDVGAIKRKIRPLREAFGAVPAANLTPRQIDTYAKERQKVVAPATLQTELVYLKQAFHIAQRNELVDKVPHTPSIKVENVRQGFFEHDEFIRVLEHLPPDIADVTEFAYYSGWRKKEIITLTWRDVTDVIRLRPEHSKNAEGRVLAIAGGIKEVIERRRAICELYPWVFHRDGEPIKYFDRSWKRACKQAGAERYFHDLRRTAVRNMVRAGVPEKVAMTISGHKTRSIFDRYHIVREDDIERALEATHTATERYTAKVTRIRD
jgi:integrase